MFNQKYIIIGQGRNFKDHTTNNFIVSQYYQNFHIEIALIQLKFLKYAQKFDVNTEQKSEVVANLKVKQK